MAKIVVLAGGDDATAVSAALDAASLEYEIVEPKPASLLHIVIGMVDDEDEEKDEDKDKKDDKEPKGDKPPKDKAPPADEPPDDSDIAADASAVEESLGMIRINGEMVEAFKQNSRDSFLFVPTLVIGAKTSYTLNESSFSFWPSNITNPAQRVLVEHNGRSTSTEVEVRKSTTGKAFLAVGADIADLFVTK
jgi:hypothetical protein